MDLSQWVGLIAAAVPLVLAVWFAITLVKYKKSTDKKQTGLINVAVLGIIAGLVVVLPFIVVVLAIIGSMSFALLPIAVIPIALADVSIIMLKRYRKNSPTEELKRKRGIKAIVFGVISWFMMYALDSFLVFLLSGVISAM